LAALPDGTAARAFGRVGTDVQRLRSAVEAHVVAAACELERGTFIRALDALGIDRDALRAAARAELAAG